MQIWTELARWAVMETENLWLRPFRFSDGEDIYRLVSDQEQLDFIFPAKTSREESDNWLVTTFMKEPLGIWAIEQKGNQSCIGAVYLEGLDTNLMQVELSYFLDKGYRQQGLMTEAVQCVSDVLVSDLAFKQVTIVTHADNRAGQGVAAKAGFSYQASFKGSDRYSHQIRTYTRWVKKKK